MLINGLSLDDIVHGDEYYTVKATLGGDDDDGIIRAFEAYGHEGLWGDVYGSIDSYGTGNREIRRDPLLCYGHRPVFTTLAEAQSWAVEASDLTREMPEVWPHGGPTYEAMEWDRELHGDLPVTDDPNAGAVSNTGPYGSGW